MTQNKGYVAIIAPGAILKKGRSVRIFKTRLFAKWARKEKLNDQLLSYAINEIDQGIFEAELGGEVYKKRIALRGQGKRSARSIIAFRSGDRACFIFGYAKKDRATITQEEKRIAKAFAKELFSYRDEQLDRLLKAGKLIEVNYDG